MMKLAGEAREIETQKEDELDEQGIDLGDLGGHLSMEMGVGGCMGCE